MMNITQEEINKLKATKNEREWNAVCDEVKRVRSGSYPGDWFEKVNMSGLMREVAQSWAN